jgi:hypothetical protein
MSFPATEIISAFRPAAQKNSAILDCRLPDLAAVPARAFKMTIMLYFSGEY